MSRIADHRTPRTRMPELPDIVVYIENLQARIVGQQLIRARLLNPFVLRSVVPPLSSIEGSPVLGVRRIGKRVVIEFAEELFLVIHLMIAGRLRWLPAGKKPPARLSLAAFEFANGVLVLTEAGSKRRASLHLLQGSAQLAAIDPGGIEVLDADLSTFSQTIKSSNHTLKRSLTDPHLFSGIGNAYSDEILHRAKLSPFALTAKLDDNEVARLFAASQSTLREWTDRLRAAAGAKFPEKVTAFHAAMAAHGRFGLPCPVCATPIQRIVYADNETNYCPRCQTQGRILADRALSRLLHDSWPRSIDELG